MSPTKSTLRIRHFSLVAQTTDLDHEIDAFPIDRRARGLSSGTIRFYTQKLKPFRDYLRSLDISAPEAITAPIVRRFLLDFGTTHNPGGVHAVYRTIKAFLRWYEQEVEPEDWKNPMPKVRPPRVPREPLKPVELSDMRAMIATCRMKTLLDLRDKVILLTLLDTGCRASEVTSLNVGDVDLHSGSVMVRRGKGGKWRTVFLGSKTRRALIAYLRLHRDASDQDPLFATTQGGRLKYESLRDIVRRRAVRADLPAPTLHSFRRAFALLSLRNGVDVFSLQRLLGHADLSVLRRYLAQNNEDLRRAHERTGPVDSLL